MFCSFFSPCGHTSIESTVLLVGLGGDFLSQAWWPTDDHIIKRHRHWRALWNLVWEQRWLFYAQLPQSYKRTISQAVFAKMFCRCNFPSLGTRRTRWSPPWAVGWKDPSGPHRSQNPDLTSIEAERRTDLDLLTQHQCLIPLTLLWPNEHKSRHSYTPEATESLPGRVDVIIIAQGDYMWNLWFEEHIRVMVRCLQTFGLSVPVCVTMCFWIVGMV